MCIAQTLGIAEAFSHLVREMWILQEHNSCRPDYIKVQCYTTFSLIQVTF